MMKFWHTIGNLKVVAFLASMFVFSVLQLSAQQIPSFSLFQENGFVLNPAIVGSEQKAKVLASYRRQWMSVEQAPETQTVSALLPFYKKNIGIGIFVVNDQTGPTGFTELNLSYAYHLAFKKINPFFHSAIAKNSKISIGVSFSLRQYRLKGSELILDQPDDPIIDYQNHFSYLPNAGAGIYYYFKDFHAGFSIPQLLPLTANFGNGNEVASIEKVFHYFVVVGGKIKTGHRWKLEPNAWYKQAKSSPWQVDGYLRARYRDQFWLGAGYRTSGTIYADLGFLIKERLQIGYAYDHQIQSVSKLLGSSHEVVIAYQFQTKFTDNRTRRD